MAVVKIGFLGGMEMMNYTEDLAKISFMEVQVTINYMEIVVTII